MDNLFEFLWSKIDCFMWFTLHVNGGSANNETLSLLSCTYGNQFLFLLWCFGRKRMEWNFVGAIVIVFCFLRLQNN